MNEFPLNDNHYEDIMIREVNKEDGGWSIIRDDGWCFFVEENSSVKPEPGMTSRFYGKGIGYSVRGLFLDGHKIFYRTEEEQHLKEKKEWEKCQQEKKEDFLNNSEQYYKDIEKLPIAFQKRIKRFQDNNPDFDWEFGFYELHCCKLAVAAANKLLTVEEIDKFKTLNVNEQEKMVPGIVDSSGNQFFCACALAQAYLKNADIVINMHGAMTPVVGCEKYGCNHPN